ncbi:MAG: class I SAM-dependent methyltransferase [Clostridia bacterium]|nr:class I SAM-dependent methyltransferase [Clostridia bacterium]
MDAYSVIAKIYDKANTDFDYSEYYEFTKHYLTGKVVELGCGSGAFTDYLIKSADKIIAVDSSKEMLEIAIQNNYKNRNYIQFVNDDLKNFAPPTKVNSVVAVCDCFNYISHEDIAGVFEKIKNYLKSDGYFVFDISTEHKLRNLLGNNVFYEDTDNYTYLWTNKLLEDRVLFDIAMFISSEDNMYKREDESHIQYIYNANELKKTLTEIGFEVRLFDGEKFCELSNTSMRALFVCKKQ